MSLRYLKNVINMNQNGINAQDNNMFSLIIYSGYIILPRVKTILSIVYFEKRRIYMTKRSMLNEFICVEKL